MSEKRIEDWQALGRDVANLRLRLLELEGNEPHIARIGKHLDSVSGLVEAAVMEERSEARDKEP